MRELNDIEQGLAEDLCDARWKKNADHGEALDGDTACSACRADIVRLVDEGVTPQAPPIQHAEVPEGPTNERVRYALDAIYNTLDAYCGGVDEKSSIDEWMQTIRAACLQTAGPMPEVREEDIAYFREGIERLDDNRMRRGLTETEERLRARLPRILALLEWAAGMKGGANG